jgi:hypothetical protein
MVLKKNNVVVNSWVHFNMRRFLNINQVNEKKLPNFMSCLFKF